jgi:hypothetical protein
MSQATVRATKREIRRAIGPEAIEAIDRIAKAGEGLAQIVAKQQEQIDGLLDTTGLLIKWRIDALEDRVSANNSELLINQAAIADEQRVGANFRGRSFLARLRWLVRGT